MSISSTGLYGDSYLLEDVETLKSNLTILTTDHLSTKTEHDERLDLLEISDVSNITRIGNLEISDASNIIRIGDLETDVSSNTTRIDALEVSDLSNIKKL
jgi:hypothetical protein